MDFFKIFLGMMDIIGQMGYTPPMMPMIPMMPIKSTKAN
jgi:hypothetical protein